MSPEVSRTPPGRRRERCRNAPRDRTRAGGHLAAPVVTALIVGATLTALPALSQDVIAQLEPGPAWNLTVDRGVETLHLSWNPPNGTPDGELAGYAIYRGTGPDSLDLHDRTAETDYNDTGLGDNATFFYRVNATYADASEGDGTDVVGATTYARPDPPRNVTATAGPTPGNVTVDWLAPADDGGLNVTSYNVTARDATGNVTGNWTLDAANTTLVDGNLSAGTTRTYAVAATNAAGTGNASEPVQATTWTRPSAPRDLVAETGSGAGEIELNWTAPLDDGGTNLTSYVIYREGPDGGFDPVGTVHADLDGFVDVGLAPGTSYNYTVAARNAVGVGNRSDDATAATHDVPAAPTADAEAGPDLGTVTVTWSPPDDDGGLAVSGYHLFRRVDGDWTGVAILDATTTEHVESGLPGNATVEYAVAAENPAGTGDRSAPATARTFEVPPAPTGTEARTGPDPGEITLTWQAPTLTDGTLVGYAVEVLEDGDRETLVELDADATRHVLQDLPPETRRVLAVRTLADIGPGEASDAVAATTYGPPPAPTEITSGAVDGAVEIAWTPPTDLDLELTGYRVERRAGPDADWTPVADLDPDATTYRDPDPPLGQETAYRVAAENAAGRGPSSETTTVLLADDDGSTSPSGTDETTDDGTGATVTDPPTGGTQASSIPLTGIGLVGALGLIAVLIAGAAVVTRPTRDEPFDVLAGQAGTATAEAGAATATTPVAALPAPADVDPSARLAERIRSLHVPDAPEPLTAVRDRLAARVQELRCHPDRVRAVEVDAVEADLDRFAELVDAFEVARRRVDATADAVARAPPATADATAAGLRTALRRRADVDTSDLDVAAARVAALSDWSHRVADARDRIVAWAADADETTDVDRREESVPFWRRLVGRLLAARRPAADLGDVLHLRLAARDRALARLDDGAPLEDRVHDDPRRALARLDDGAPLEDRVHDDPRQALAARVAGAALAGEALDQAPSERAHAIRDRLDEIVDVGLLGPALADLATGDAPTDLDTVVARQDRILAVEVPRIVGAPAASAGDAEVADRLAEVAARRSEAPAAAVRAYAAGKTADLGDVDAWLVDAVATAHAAALPDGEGEPGFDAAVAEAIRSDLDRFDVVHRDRLAARLVADRAEVETVLAAMAAEGEIVLDDDTGLVGRSVDLDADRVHQLRRRHDGIPDDQLSAFIQTLQSDGDDDA